MCARFCFCFNLSKHMREIKHTRFASRYAHKWIFDAMRCEVKRNEPSQTEPIWSEIGFLCSGTKRLISKLREKKEKKVFDMIFCVCTAYSMWIGPVVKQVCVRQLRRPECFSNNYRMWHSSWTTRSLTHSLTRSLCQDKETGESSSGKEVVEMQCITIGILSFQSAFKVCFRSPKNK